MSCLSLKSSPSSDKNKSITQNEKGVAFYHVLMPLTPISPVRKRTALTMTMRTKLKERGIFLVQNTLSGCTIVLSDREDCFPALTTALYVASSCKRSMSSDNGRLRIFLHAERRVTPSKAADAWMSVWPKHYACLGKQIQQGLKSRHFFPQETTYNKKYMLEEQSMGYLS